jgi:hypothetical protein
MPIGQTSNPQLAQAEQAIQAKIPPALQGGFAKVLHAGLSILYAPQLRSKLQQKLAGGNPIQDAGQGAARLAAELYKQSGNTIPKPLIVPAVIVFAFEYLDLAAQAGKIQITPAVIAQAAQTAAAAFLKMAGLNPEQLRQQGEQQSAPRGLVARSMAQEPQ